MAEQWKEGDLVQLKSGGPIMTVESATTYEGKTSIFCAWFDKTQKMTGSFPPATLQRYTEEPTSNV